MIIEDIKKDGRLLYSYIRGSHCHGIATEKSDIDVGGVFISEKNKLIGLGFDYESQISDERNDVTYYELRKFMSLLVKSNPTILESLFVSDKFVNYEHDIMKEIKSYRNEFLTKECFNSFFRYAEAQIQKARGLKKMINWDKEQMSRKTPFDFAYTFYKQGSTKIKTWLENRGLDKDFCGLVHIPNMHDVYGVYYDWGAHFEKYGIKSIEDLKKSVIFDLVEAFYNLTNEYDGLPDNDKVTAWFNKNKEVLHYRGMCLENATDMRGSSVSKGEKPLCWMTYNESGFQSHCVKYKQYQDWVKHRNPVRYESNLDKSYDSKNICECFRLMKCGIEIANGQGYIVDRSGIDADFLLDIRAHKFEYEYLIGELEKLKAEMNNAMAKSTIKESVDPNFVNELYLKLLKSFYGI